MSQGSISVERLAQSFAIQGRARRELYTSLFIHSERQSYLRETKQ